uniref:AP2/ERF domain-containing protein n=1 Tax=Physcomitrium patens TaxID=3218 RepID=A0A7I4CE67_PHYPA
MRSLTQIYRFPQATSQCTTSAAVFQLWGGSHIAVENRDIDLTGTGCYCETNCNPCNHVSRHLPSAIPRFIDILSISSPFPVFRGLLKESQTYFTIDLLIMSYNCTCTAFVVHHNITWAENDSALSGEKQRPLRLKILKGLSELNTGDPIYVTVECIIRDDFPENPKHPGDTKVICRPIDVDPEMGSKVVSGNKSDFILGKSRVFPFDILLCTEKYEDISDKESLWQEQMRKLQETPLSYVEVLDDVVAPRLDETYEGVSVASNGDHLLERCHPCFLCTSCTKQWGGSLPERYFPSARKEFFRSAGQESPPVLDSEKTIAATKRKRGQGRHGPKSKTSPYRGVNHYTRTNRWEAHIWCIPDDGTGSKGLRQSSLVSLRSRNGSQLSSRRLPRRDLFRANLGLSQCAIYIDSFEFFFISWFDSSFLVLAELHRLTQGQMVAYLRREARGTGEEVRYPGVAKINAKMYEAFYRPRKDKESQEHIGYFRSEDDAVRAVMREAKRRKNFNLAARIMDIHHLRTVRPAPGKVKRPRKPRKNLFQIGRGTRDAASVPEQESDDEIMQQRRKRTSRSKNLNAALPAQRDVSVVESSVSALRKRQPRKNASRCKITTSSSVLRVPSLHDIAVPEGASVAASANPNPQTKKMLTRAQKSATRSPVVPTVPDFAIPAACNTALPVRAYKTRSRRAPLRHPQSEETSIETVLANTELMVVDLADSAPAADGALSDSGDQLSLTEISGYASPTTNDSSIWSNNLSPSTVTVTCDFDHGVAVAGHQSPDHVRMVLGSPVVALDACDLPSETPIVQVEPSFPQLAAGAFGQWPTWLSLSQLPFASRSQGGLVGVAPTSLSPAVIRPVARRLNATGGRVELDLFPHLPAGGGGLCVDLNGPPPSG